MDDNTTLMRLEELADALGIPVRYEKIPDEEDFIISGGLCRLEGNPVIIINSRVGTRTKIRALVSALRQFDLDEVYVRPALRNLLD